MKIPAILYVIPVLLIGLVVLSAWVRALEAKRPWPFEPRAVLTRPEQVLYHRLVETLSDEYLVLAQVQLSRFLRVKRGHAPMKWLNRINRLSADFLILRRDASVVLAIELDGATHERAANAARDARKNKALADAGVRLVRWNVKALPDAAAIRQAVASPVQSLAKAA